MDVVECFQQWICDGAPKKRTAGARGVKRKAGSLSSDAITRLKNECRSQTCQRLGDVLTTAAREERKKRMSGTTYNIKLELAFNFFQQLSPEQQDEICPLAKAARTGVADQLAQSYLNELTFTQPESKAETEPTTAAEEVEPSPTSAAVSRFSDCKHPDKQRSRFVRKISGDIASRVETFDEAMEVAQSLQTHLAKTFREKTAKTLGCDTCNNICQCLGAYRQELATSQGNVSLLDKHLASTKLHRHQLQELGIQVSKLKWQQAQAASSGAVVPEPRGRPSKVKDPHWIALVTGTVEANSQESSVWLPDFDRNARTLTSSIFSMWINCGYAKKLSWKQFRLIFVGHCGFAKPASRMTDYCDHCWFLQSSIEPGLKKFTKEAQSQITNLFPPYFENWSPNSKDNTLQVAQAFLQFLDSGRGATKKQRRTLGVALQLSLHELEAKITHHLRWEVTVADAYFWHKESADRQTAAVSLLYIGDYTFLVLGKDSLSVGN